MGWTLAYRWSPASAPPLILRANGCRALKRRGQENYGGGAYKESTRHYVEIAHHSYRKRVERLVAQMRV